MHQPIQAPLSRNVIFIVNSTESHFLKLCTVVEFFTLNPSE